MRSFAIRWTAPLALLIYSLAATAACPSNSHETSLANFALSPDGRQIVAIAADGTVFLWDVQTGKRSTIIECIAVPPFWSPVEFSRDSARVALAERGTVEIMEVPSGRRLQKLDGNGEEIEHLVFSANGARLAAAVHIENTGALIVWELSSSKKVLSISRRPGRFAFALSTNGELMIVQGREGIEVWNVDQNALVRTIALGANENAEALAFTDNDKRLIASTATALPPSPGDQHFYYERSISVWEIASGRRIKTLAGPAGELFFPLVLTSSGMILTSSFGISSEENKLRILNLDTGRLAAEWSSQPGTPSADGQFLLRGTGWQGRLELWKIGSQKSPRQFEYRSPLCEPIDWKSSAREKVRFDSTWMGDGRTDDGEMIGFAGYVAQDCTRLGRSHYYFDSEERAKKELQHEITKATAVLENGWPKGFWAYGLLGQRVVLRFSGDSSEPDTFVIAWTDEKTFVVVHSTSLELALEFERQSHKTAKEK